MMKAGRGLAKGEVQSVCLCVWRVRGVIICKEDEIPFQSSLRNPAVGETFKHRGTCSGKGGGEVSKQ